MRWLRWLDLGDYRGLLLEIDEGKEEEENWGDEDEDSFSSSSICCCELKAIYLGTTRMAASLSEQEEDDEEADDKSTTTDSDELLSFCVCLLFLFLRLCFHFSLFWTIAYIASFLHLSDRNHLRKAMFSKLHEFMAGIRQLTAIIARTEYISNCPTLLTCSGFETRPIKQRNR